MFGSSILDIAIGMVLVYLILSLIVTALNELISSTLKLRANNLAAAIRELLDEDKPREPGAAAAPATVHSVSFYEHPLINCLSKGPDGRPSYIPSRTFALALLDLVDPANPMQARTLDTLKTGINGLPEELKRTLTVLLDDAGHDVEKFKTALEGWFNNVMVRAAGWYKRQTQPILLFLALGVTILFNVDSLNVAQSLANDKTLRDSVVAQAQEIAKQPPSSTPAVKPDDAGQEIKTAAVALNQSVKSIDGLKLPIGWDAPIDPKTSPLNRACGWLITTFAVSLGAPFWFDLLNRFMSIRSAGRAPEETAKAPKEQPKAAGPGADPGDQASEQ
jgi:hypothetical protein